MTRLWRTTIASPLGPIIVATRGHRVCAVDFYERWRIVQRRLQKRFGEIEWIDAQTRTGPTPTRSARVTAGQLSARDAKWMAALVKRFAAYFAGQTHALSGLRVDPEGTPFQLAVWRALQRVPAGSLTTYRELARAAGRPRAARAAGHAAGSNLLALVIPCHRAIGSDGELRGYAGGISRKAWLLTHESRGRDRSTGRRSS